MKRVLFVEMMGERGSYDASVYDHFEDKDNEGAWFVKRFSDVEGITITTCNICHGAPLPDARQVDGVVLAGSYNSVHDQTPWQSIIREWLPTVRAQKIPVLAICGSHQLIAHSAGAKVKKVPNGPYAGTFPLDLTDAGRGSVIMASLPVDPAFQFANSEHVLDIPVGATLLASSGPVAVAALDYGDHWYSTQFHPEGTHETLSCVWQFTRPEFMDKYHMEENGLQMVRNFLGLIAAQ